MKTTINKVVGRYGVCHSLHNFLCFPGNFILSKASKKTKYLTSNKHHQDLWAKLITTMVVLVRKLMMLWCKLSSKSRVQATVAVLKAV